MCNSPWTPRSSGSISMGRIARCTIASPAARSPPRRADGRQQGTRARQGSDLFRDVFVRTRERAGTAASSRKPAGRPEPGPRHWVLLGVALATVVEAVAPSNFLLADITGLWLVLFAPIAIWYGCAVKAVAGKEAAVFVALGFALITDMLL